MSNYGRNYEPIICLRATRGLAPGLHLAPGNRATEGHGHKRDRHARGAEEASMNTAPAGGEWDETVSGEGRDVSIEQQLVEVEG